MNKKERVVLVCGASGFIGGHLVSRLKSDGHKVIAVDQRLPGSHRSEADEFYTGDLRDQSFANSVIDRPFDEVYQMATDMGGAGYLFTGEHDADIMYNASMINLNVLAAVNKAGAHKVFYPSSACVYPNRSEQADFSEEDAYPAQPFSEYGWEKIFSERLYLSFMRNYKIQTKIARFHTIFGERCHFDGGREKVHAALARKVLMADDPGEIEIWGDGEQQRSFLYIDDCLDAVEMLMQSDSFHGPVNIGSDQMISINQLAHLMIGFSDKHISIRHVDGPIGLKSRNSDNTLVVEKLGWKPTGSLEHQMLGMYRWIESQIEQLVPDRLSGDFT